MLPLLAIRSKHHRPLGGLHHHVLHADGDAGRPVCRHGQNRVADAVLKALADKYGLGYLTLPNRATLTAAQKFRYVNNAYVRYLGLLLQGDLGPSIDYENWAVRDIVAAVVAPVSGLRSAVSSLLIAMGAAYSLSAYSGADPQKSTALTWASPSSHSPSRKPPKLRSRPRY